MAIKITLKNSVVQDSVPTTSHLAAVGELALNANINSLGIYMRASDNSIVKMAGPGSVTTPAASTTAAGIAELATSAETTTGTDTARVTTPAGVKAVTDAERTTSNNTYLALAGGTLTGVLAATAGSNSAPAIHFGDSDSGVFGGTNTVSLTAGGTTRLTADTGVSVTGTLAVTGAITSTDDLTIPDKIIHSGDTDTAIRFPAADTVSVETGGSESARIDSSGRLLVGSSSTIPVGSTASALTQVHGTANALLSSFVAYANNSGGAVLALGKSRGAVGTPGTTVQNNDALGAIRFAGDDGTDIQTQAALFECRVDGTVASNQIPAEFVLKTAASDGTMTTRLTIDSAGLVNVPDNGKFTAGASDDLQIYHDGTNSHITNNTGKLLLRSAELKLQGSGGTDTYLRGVEDGSCELYYDNTKRFETTSTGATISGDLTLNDSTPTISLVDTNDSDSTGIIQHTSGNLKLKADSNEAMGSSSIRFEVDGSEKWKIDSNGWLENNLDSGGLKVGASDDLQIYHSSNNNYIDSINPNYGLYIRGGTATNKKVIVQAKDDEHSIFCAGDGQVELYYDYSMKLQTTAGGVTITGTDASDGTIIKGDLRLNKEGETATKIKWDGSEGTDGHLEIFDDVKLVLGAAQDLQIYHDGSHSYIEQDGTGKLIIQGNDNDQLKIMKGSSEEGIILNNNGNVELYYDNSKKFETTSSGATLTGHLSMADSYHIQLGSTSDGNLRLYHNASNSYIDNADTGHIYIRNNTDSDHSGNIYIQPKSGEDGAVFIHDGAVELYYDNAKRFQTQSNGVGLFGLADSAGNSDLRYNSTNGTVSYDSSTRLVKKNIIDCSYGLGIVNQLKPRKYIRKDAANTEEIGFIADEVVSLIPEIVPIGPKSLITKNAADTEEIPLNVDYRKMCVVLTKAIQELSAKVAALEGA